jgi:hypothetical protein
MFWKTRIFDDSDLSMWSQNSIANLKAWIDIGYIPSSPRTANLTA